MRRVHRSMATALADAGASPRALHVEVFGALARDDSHGAKFKLIESRVGAGSA